MKKTIYVVIGSTGEYSDSIEWLVEAYENENAAKEHVKNAKEKANLWEILREDADKDYDLWPDNWNPWDKVAPYMEYNGIAYYYKSVELNEN